MTISSPSLISWRAFNANVELLWGKLTSALGSQLGLPAHKSYHKIKKEKIHGKFFLAMCGLPPAQKLNKVHVRFCDRAINRRSSMVQHNYTCNTRGYFASYWARKNKNREQNLHSNYALSPRIRDL